MNALLEIESALGKVALGDKEAFHFVYQKTSAKLFGVCLRVLQDRAQAEEALQETFVRIWHKAGTYQVNGLSPMTWLITVARNIAIDHKRRIKAPMDELPVDLSDPTPGVEAQTIARQEADALEGCLRELDPSKADAVRSAYLDGDSYADLAARHDVPLNTMRTWLRRSLLALRECLTR